MKVNADQVDAMVLKTDDAYSYDRYTNWMACVKLLYSRGYSDRAVEAILRSKWMRWAGDCAKNPNAPTSKDLARYLDDPRNRCAAQLQELIDDTF